MRRRALQPLRVNYAKWVLLCVAWKRITPIRIQANLTFNHFTCTCGGIHPGLIEPASPRRGDVSWVPSPGVAAFIGFAVQAKLVWFVSAGASALHTPSILVLLQATLRGRKG